ncbi:protein of unknown function (plasmid) [Nitratireductor aquimarinus]
MRMGAPEAGNVGVRGSGHGSGALCE